MMEYFLIVSLVCGLVILFAAIITKLLHNKIERQWRYVVWIVLAVRLLFPIDISLPTPVFTVELPGVEESMEDIPMIPVHNTIQIPVNNTEVPEYPSISMPVENIQPSVPVTSMPVTVPQEPAFVFEWSMLWDVLPWVWLLGMVLSALWYLIGYAYQKHELLRWS